MHKALTHDNGGGGGGPNVTRPAHETFKKWSNGRPLPKQTTNTSPRLDISMFANSMAHGFDSDTRRRSGRDAEAVIVQKGLPSGTRPVVQSMCDTANLAVSDPFGSTTTTAHDTTWGAQTKSADMHIAIMFLHKSAKTSGSFWNRAASWWTGSDIIHTEIYFEHVQQPCVVSSRSPVQFRTNRSYLHADEPWEAIVLRVPAETYIRVFNFCVAEQTKPFDTYGIYCFPCVSLRDWHPGWICSRLVAQALIDADILRSPDGDFGIDVNTATPKSLYDLLRAPHASGIVYDKNRSIFDQHDKHFTYQMSRLMNPTESFGRNDKHYAIVRKLFCDMIEKKQHQRNDQTS